MVGNPRSKAKLRDETAIDPFTPDEIRLICAACDGQLRNLAQLGFWTGVRASELFAPRWPGVDWRRGLVRVQRARVRGETKTTKTAAGLRDVKAVAAGARGAAGATNPY
jgi:integrase